MKSISDNLDELTDVPASMKFVLVLLLLPLSHAARQEKFKMGARKVVEPGNERWIESTGGDCSEDDVAVYQGDTSPLPNGIPTYTVQILNKCVSGCAIADIHVSCQWFSSARAINPRVFRRLDFDDCLVNDGAPIPPGSSISFQYANSFRYPLAVSSLNCSRK